MSRHGTPVARYSCMEDAICIDMSNEKDPYVECQCQLGKVKKIYRAVLLKCAFCGCYFACFKAYFTAKIGLHLAKSLN